MKNFWDAHGVEQAAYKASVHWQTSQEVAIQFELPQEFFGRFAQGNLGELAEFREGLWQSDCLEVFIFFADGSYREWNLGANLDWWSCGFASYRKQQARPSEQAFRPKQLLLNAEGRTLQWRVDCGRSVSEIIHWRACVVDKKIPEPHLLSSDKIAAKGRDFHLDCTH